MVSKNKASGRRSKGKAPAKGKSGKRSKAQRSPKRPETKKAETSITILPPATIEHVVRESYRITVENIRAETVIGDLLVAFPRTRDLLARNGLKLEAEDAGDIYITLEAFSALNGLKTELLVRDLVGIARESILQQAAQQPVHQMATAPAV
jgi:hypothetical protein